MKMSQTELNAMKMKGAITTPSNDMATDVDENAKAMSLMADKIEELQKSAHMHTPAPYKFVIEYDDETNRMTSVIATPIEE